MDLTSSGGKMVNCCVLKIVILCMIFSIPAQSQMLESHTENYQDALLDEDYRVSGDIYIIHTAAADLGDNIEHVLQKSLEKYGQVIVKLSGNSISIVRDIDALRGLLHKERLVTTSGDIAKDLLDVIYVCEKKSHIYLVEDQETPMTDEADMVLQILKDTPIRVDIITVKTNANASRVRRAINFYQLLANVSGGSVITTDKNNIASAVDIIKQSLQTSMITVMKFATSDPPGKVFRVPIDDTMTQITVQVQVENYAPVFIATMPSSVPCPAHQRKLGAPSAGSVVSILEYNLTQPTDHGNWKLMKMDGYKWDISIKGHSPVDFTHEFVEPGPGGYGEYPIKGRPIAGVSYKMIVTVPEYTKVNAVKVSFLMSRDKFTPIGFAGLTNVGGRRGKSMWYGNITVPTQVFMVAIEGRDNSGNPFRRIDPMLITPISIRLDVPSLAGVKLYVNETVTIPFNVTNAASADQDLDIRIEDDQGFTQAPNIISKTLSPGSSGTDNFLIKAGSVPGVTVTVTITAKPYIPGGFSQGQYEIRRFTVVERPKKPEDKIDPTCNVTKVTGTCNIGSDLCACSKHTWSMEIEIGDEGFGVREVFPTGDNSSYTFTHDNFTKGHNISMGVIKAKFKADCCHQGASIQVVDMAGNTGQCQANITNNFTPPDPKLCNNSTLNLTLSCKNVVKSGTCTPSANPCDCDQDSWHVQVEFDTAGWNLTQVFTSGVGNNGSLVRRGNIVELDSDCCHQEVTINAQDIAGNIGQCNATLTNFTLPPQCTTTTSTTSTTTAATTSTDTTLSASSTPLNSTATSGATASNTTGNTASLPTGTGSATTGLVSGTTLSSHKPGSVTSASSGIKPTGTNAPGMSTTKPSAPGTGTAGTSGASGTSGTATKPPVAGTGLSTNKYGVSGAFSTTPASGTPNVQTSPTSNQTTGNGNNSGNKGGNDSNNNDNTNGITATSVGVGMAMGAVIGVSSIVAMAFLFRKAISKGGSTISPEEDEIRRREQAERERDRRQSNLAWS